ncbi:DUF4864 domain-containing protein [Roseovarius indicus]|uniref:DUF4864 domain-containing protein n=1 Tax=Roseovarius indicus TaxID=540747 RepID=A0A0T5P801_9RHOB|nr:DUF4864 domain-containing protein [Roseovarius indicus]KRS17188.1 hypothetical protein XM52_14010 [Roseovarius indicus]QEW27565.1 hypothetical protein RIdsm_03381 [Roseovarius indicus]SFE35700.1 protein of unknown function [Roseovarius indicus]
MRHMIAAVLMTLALALPAKANEDIEKVITSQIDAFLADDFETAFTYASPMIKDIFGTPEKFGQMVRQGYPMVWRPSEVNFLSIDRRGKELWQNVMVRDAEGALYILEYQMIPGEMGWLINAVRVRKATEGTA